MDPTKVARKFAVNVAVKKGSQLNIATTLTILSAYALSAKGASNVGDIVPDTIPGKSLIDKVLGKKFNEVGQGDLQNIQQTALKNATATIKLADFLGKQSEISSVFPAETGCFVITTHKDRGSDKKLANYIGIFIDKAANLAADIPAALSASGNPKVYDDVTNNRNVHIYAFACPEKDVEEVYESLQRIFSDSERCYHPTKTIAEETAELVARFKGAETTERVKSKYSSLKGRFGR